MNWEEIKKKYPKGYESAKMWWIDEADLSQFEDFEPCSGLNINVRFLYDFFDESGIIIEVTLSYSNDINWFEYNIDLLDDRDDFYSSMEEPDYSEPYKTKTRTGAEEQAFLKAFEILEARL